MLLNNQKKDTPDALRKVPENSSQDLSAKARETAHD